MSRYRLVVGLSVLALAAGPAFAQSSSSPAQGTVQPRHVTHPAPAHKMPQMSSSSNPDRSADQLNAKELASIQHGAPAMASPPPTKTP